MLSCNQHSKRILCTSRRYQYFRILHCMYPLMSLRIPYYSMRTRYKLYCPTLSCNSHPTRKLRMSRRCLHYRVLHCMCPLKFLHNHCRLHYTLRKLCCPQPSCTCLQGKRCTSHRYQDFHILHYKYPLKFLHNHCRSHRMYYTVRCLKQFCMCRLRKLRTYWFRYRSTPRLRTPLLQGLCRRWNGRTRQNTAVKSILQL
jgi:hypothetical protein